MKRILIALLLLLSSVPAYAQQTRAALVTEVGVNWPDNTTGAITPALLRSTVIDIINSYLGSEHLKFSSGYITSISSASGLQGFSRFIVTSTLDNLIGSVDPSISCTVTPQINLIECGTSNFCTSPVATLGFVQAGVPTRAFVGTVVSPTVSAGDFVAWSVTPGTCSLVNVYGTAQFHAQ